MSAIEEIWYGRGVVPASARIALAPFAAAYGAAVRARAALYDAGVLRATRAGLPTLVVGNLTAGGTGKTPVSAWLADRLSARARTAVALRGYGADEIDVHAHLNPHVPVVVGADRLEAIRTAKGRGAEVVVLDDAFQHRRLLPSATVVLLSVEQLMRPRRLLPAGPWREPLAAARRADLVVYTRKSADAALADSAIASVQRVYQGPSATVYLAPSALRQLSAADELPLTAIRDRDVLAVAAIGEPESFRRQLEALGARVTLMAFRDHHPFTPADVHRIASHVPAGGLAICTLKDAVKLAPQWPGAGVGALWYLSQQLVVERGEDSLNHLLERVLAARQTATFAG